MKCACFIDVVAFIFIWMERAISIISQSFNLWRNIARRTPFQRPSDTEICLAGGYSGHIV
jgi:hypothetical protein